MCSPGTRPMSADTAVPAAGEGRSWLLVGKGGDARRILHCQGHPHTPANATALQWRRSPPVRGGTRQQMGLDGDVHRPEKQVQFGVPRLRPAPRPPPASAPGEKRRHRRHRRRRGPLSSPGAPRPARAQSFPSAGRRMRVSLRGAGAAGSSGRGEEEGEQGQGRGRGAGPRCAWSSATASGSRPPPQTLGAGRAPEFPPEFPEAPRGAAHVTRLLPPAGWSPWASEKGPHAAH